MLNELKVGDSVEILPTLKDYDVRLSALKTIGKIGKVIQCFAGGDCLVLFEDLNDSWYYRAIALKKVNIGCHSQLDVLGLPLNKKEDVINYPTHYTFLQKEVIDVIKECLTPEEFKGYLKGNVIKYRMRAGIKGGTEKRQEDLDKSNWYQDRLNGLEKNK